MVWKIPDCAKIGESLKEQNGSQPTHDVNANMGQNHKKQSQHASVEIMTCSDTREDHLP